MKTQMSMTNDDHRTRSELLLLCVIQETVATTRNEHTVIR
jgi:hypothetical protein